MSEQRTTEKRCTCGHSAALHRTAKYQGEPSYHHCGVDGCDCPDYEEAESFSAELVMQGAAPREIAKRGTRTFRAQDVSPEDTRRAFNRTYEENARRRGQYDE